MSYVTNRARPSKVVDTLKFSRSRSQSPTLADIYVDRISGICKLIPWGFINCNFPTYMNFNTTNIVLLYETLHAVVHVC